MLYLISQLCFEVVNITRIKALEGERQSKKGEVISLEKSQEALRSKISELEVSLDWSKSENINSQRELAEYRAKARKILEEKEKFICTLRSGGQAEDQSEVREAEVEQLKTSLQKATAPKPSSSSPMAVAKTKYLSKFSSKFSDL